jgi:hypothetical protein
MRFITTRYFGQRIRIGYQYGLYFVTGDDLWSPFLSFDSAFRSACLSVVRQAMHNW